MIAGGRSDSYNDQSGFVILTFGTHPISQACRTKIKRNNRIHLKARSSAFGRCICLLLALGDAGRYSTEINAMQIRPLNSSEIAGFDSERNWLDDLLRHVGPEHMLQRTPNDIPTLQSLLDAKPFSTGDEASLELLGSAFGDVVATALGFDWVVATDEYGSDFAIKHPSKMILAFPRDMIVKRVESGDVINLTELYHGVLAALEEQVAADGIAHDM